MMSYRYFLIEKILKEEAVTDEDVVKHSFEELEHASIDDLEDVAAMLGL